MFESCYRHHYSAVGIVGSSAEIISSLQSHESNSIILIDYASTVVARNSLDHPASRHKLQYFLVSISSVTELLKILENLKISQWWNHMASFLIIENSTSLDHDCTKASRILFTAWKMNLLHVKYICHHKSIGPSVYSYNPYTSQAPIPWKVVKTFSLKNKHIWTLLVRSYQDNLGICKDLNFDQTKDLGGYEVRANVFSSNIYTNQTKNDLERVTGFDGILVRDMFRALNSTANIFDTQSVTNFSDSTYDEITDINLDCSFMNDNIETRMTYPHWRFELASITQHRGNLSQLGKLLRVIDLSSRYAVFIVCVITFVFFKFFHRQSVTSAILNIVRLICNVAVLHLPNNVATRVYLSGLFIFVLTLQGIYQGKLASLLTKSVALSNVETFEDLENFNYTIYGDKGLTVYFKKWNYSGRVVPLNDFNCVQYVLRDDSAACVSDRRQLVNTANEYHLHLSDTIIQIFFAFNIRSDSPLEKRWNIIISRLVESNIIEYVLMKDLELFLRKEKFYEKEKENQGFTVMTLKDLAFAFAILGIGLACATVVFFAEVLKRRK